jgi:hypothetical protein
MSVAAFRKIAVVTGASCRCLALARFLSANCVHRSGKVESGRSAESHRWAAVIYAKGLRAMPGENLISEFPKFRLTAG